MPAFQGRGYFVKYAVADNGRPCIDYPFFHPGDHCDWFECRSRRGELLCVPVIQGKRCIVINAVIIFLIHLTCKSVVIISRIADTCQHFSCLRIRDHRRAGTRIKRQICRSDLQFVYFPEHQLICGNAAMLPALKISVRLVSRPLIV